MCCILCLRRGFERAERDWRHVTGAFCLNAGAIRKDLQRPRFDALVLTTPPTSTKISCKNGFFHVFNLQLRKLYNHHTLLLCFNLVYCASKCQFYYRGYNGVEKISRSLAWQFARAPTPQFHTISDGRKPAESSFHSGFQFGADDKPRVT